MIKKAKKHIVSAFSAKTNPEEAAQLSSLKITAGIFLVVIISALAGYWLGSVQPAVVSSDLSPAAVEASTVNFIKTLVSEGVNVKSNNITESNGVYKLSITLSQGNQSAVIESYVTKDGKLLFESGMPIIPVNVTPNPPITPVVELNKSDKPVVELFVMSYCPFGTQVEKGMLPVADALGSKIEFSVKFVDYVMHGKKEIDEQLLEYCINKEQPAKYLSYLSCFLEASNTTACLTRMNITNASLATCQSETDALYNITGLFNDQTTWSGGQFPQFNIFKAENTLYGVQGSPTLVVNGMTVSSGRDPASMLKTICGAFNVQPAECSVVLSNATPSSGFGYDAGTDSGATCG